MPRPRKRGLENNSSLTSFVERIATESPRSHAVDTVEAEAYLLGVLKDMLLKEISNVTSELKSLKVDFKKFDSRLTQIGAKINIYEKTSLQLQKELKGTQEEILQVKKREETGEQNKV